MGTLLDPAKGEAFAREMVRLGVEPYKPGDENSTMHVEIKDGQRVFVKDADTLETDKHRRDVDTYAGEYLVKENPAGRWVEADYAIALRSEINALREAIRLTIMENPRLADGDVCTLKRLKDAIGFELPDDCIVKFNHAFMRDIQFHSYCPECGVDLEKVTDEE